MDVLEGSYPLCQSWADYQEVKITNNRKSMMRPSGSFYRVHTFSVKAVWIIKKENHYQLWPIQSQ